VTGAPATDPAAVTTSPLPESAGAGREPVSWSVAGALDRAARFLAARGVEESRLAAELLLADTLDLPRLELYLRHDRRLADVEAARFGALVRRRAEGEPVQYVLGRAGFRKLVLRVTPDVLIPRPETERLVEEVLAWLRAARPAGARVLDVGTGSGAVALAILDEAPGTAVVATDVSGPALAVAAANAAACGHAARLQLRAGPLLEPLEAGEVFDAVVANLPYVADAERATLPREVREREPGVALFAGPTGLELVARLVAAAPARLTAGGLLACELAPHQIDEAHALVNATPGLAWLAAFRDLTGRERGFLALRTGDPAAERGRAVGAEESGS
jgi:release factor glutamine methyltransferase